jgi:ribonuclease P protein component
MKKIQSLKSTIEFNKVIKTGKKVKSNYLFISYIDADDFKIGISIPKKLGNAVLRNKFKRQLKEIITKADMFSLNKHITVIVRDT